MTWFGTFQQATNAAYIAFRRVFADPANAQAMGTFQSQNSSYDLLWAYYTGSVFDRGVSSLGNWAAYRKNYNLYRQIRTIYNPVTRLCNFYAGQVYPGVLSEDGLKLPEGTKLAIPFAEDTDPALKAAIAQFWQWSNWQSKKRLHVLYAAALGSSLGEICDDLETGTVSVNYPWPGHVTDLELDGQGNVKSYVLQYQVTEENTTIKFQGVPLTTKNYTFRKEVDSESIRYFKNNQPYDYGQGAVIPNIYGFVPAVWFKHQDVGADHGSPAIAGCMGKIDELNNVASHVHDQIHKVIGAPILISATGNGKITSMFNQGKRSDNPGEQDYQVTESDRESLLMLKAPQGTTVASLAGQLSLADSALYMDRLVSEIAADNPEINFWDKLREMSQVTGPAAEILMGDVKGRISDVASGHDQQNQKLFQMAAAIGGFRANSGSWGSRSELTKQQQKFLPFNLESYVKGDLDLVIMPRPLVPPTKKELADEQVAQATAVSTFVSAGVALPVALKTSAGWTDDQIAEQATAKQEAQQQALDFMQKQQAIQPPQPQQQPGQSGNQNNNQPTPGAAGPGKDGQQQQQPQHDQGNKPVDKTKPQVS